MARTKLKSRREEYQTGLWTENGIDAGTLFFSIMLAVGTGLWSFVALISFGASIWLSLLVAAAISLATFGFSAWFELDEYLYPWMENPHTVRKPFWRYNQHANQGRDGLIGMYHAHQGWTRSNRHRLFRNEKRD